MRNDTKLEPAICSPTAEAKDQIDLWQGKYERLLHSYIELQKLNQELEERLLNVVEKTEADKMLLSNEIDSMHTKLETANDQMQRLHVECARYKSDCVLAVHLLQCQPAMYKKNPAASVLKHAENGGVLNNANKTEHDHDKRSGSKENTRVVHVTSFPPTALIFAENEEDNAQDELASTISRSISSTSLGEKFAEHINARSDYQNVMLCRLCVNCGKSKGYLDKNTQTSAGPIRARASSSGGTDLMSFDGSVFPNIHSPPPVGNVDVFLHS